MIVFMICKHNVEKKKKKKVMNCYSSVDILIIFYAICIVQWLSLKSFLHVNHFTFQFEW